MVFSRTLPTPDSSASLLKQPEWEQDHVEFGRRLGLGRGKGWGS